MLYELATLETIIAKMEFFQIANSKYLEILNDCEIMIENRILRENTSLKFSRQYLNIEGTKKIKKYIVNYLEQFLIHD